MKIFSNKSNYDKYYKNLVPYLKKEDSQKYFYIILSISASIFFLIFAIKPTLTTIVNLRKQITDAKFVENRLSEKINNLSSLTTQFREIEEDLPLVFDAVPNNPNAPELVGQINSLAQETNVVITNIEVLPLSLTTKATSSSSSFNFDVSGSSSFTDTQTFIINLINMQRVVSISSVQISKSSKTENDVDFNLKGSVFYKK